MQSHHASQKKFSAQKSKAPTSNFLASRPFAAQAKPEETERSHPTQGYKSTLGDFAILNPDAGRTMPLQFKLAIGVPGDKYEQEADHVAKQVVQRINAPQSPPLQRQEMSEDKKELQRKPELRIQRREIPDDEDELQMKPMLQFKLGQGGMAASPELESSIQRLRGSGQPLSAQIREPMEQAFGGVDFSGVKVHTDSQSDQLNQSIQAKAFTTGQDIFFRQREYNPGSRGGQELIAHELTHVVQQKNQSIIQRVSYEQEDQKVYGQNGQLSQQAAQYRLKHKIKPAQNVATFFYAERNNLKGPASSSDTKASSGHSVKVQYGKKELRTNNSHSEKLLSDQINRKDWPQKIVITQVYTERKACPDKTIDIWSNKRIKGCDSLIHQLEHEQKLQKHDNSNDAPYAMRDDLGIKVTHTFDGSEIEIRKNILTAVQQLKAEENLNELKDLLEDILQEIQDHYEQVKIEIESKFEELTKSELQKQVSKDNDYDDDDQKLRNVEYLDDDGNQEVMDVEHSDDDGNQEVMDVEDWDDDDDEREVMNIKIPEYDIDDYSTDLQTKDITIEKAIEIYENKIIKKIERVIQGTTHSTDLQDVLDKYKWSND
ncbi:DUF4157 domain-containing protein [Nostoc sp. CENA67]|uniref:DUF4157 domain-containing protein n=1 Tax=Amazonocrinis nigriterrae CENA67 TaxID=2794033 RepID=A0A8J7HZ91_9NOST|nr:DUF4157 domain-containing protein [Amazonocrinis nigriterrae]MBH8566970.1 DUF4157 domain-containing protein [Amazonocrinis nigriterrae CENA67]